MKTSRVWLYGNVVRFFPETRLFGLKRAMLRWCGCKVGKNARVCSSAKIFGDGELSIGDETWIGEDVFIKTTGDAHISIGSCCDIAPQVTMDTGTHEIDPSGSHVAGAGCSRPIEIGDGCWLGMKSTILPGVRLPAKTLVAAGAVVVKSVEEEKCLVAGVPAVAKRRL